MQHAKTLEDLPEAIKRIKQHYLSLDHEDDPLYAWFPVAFASFGDVNRFHGRSSDAFVWQKMQNKSYMGIEYNPEKTANKLLKKLRERYNIHIKFDAKDLYNLEHEEVFSILEGIISKMWGKVHAIHVRHPGQCFRTKDAWMPYEVDPDYIMDPNDRSRLERKYTLHIVLEVTEHANEVLAEVVRRFGHYKMPPRHEPFMNAHHVQGPVFYDADTWFWCDMGATISRHAQVGTKARFFQDLREFSSSNNMRGVRWCTEIMGLIWDEDMVLYNGQRKLHIPVDCTSSSDEESDC